MKTTLVAAAAADHIPVWLNDAHKWYRISCDARIALERRADASQRTAALLARIMDYDPTHPATLELKVRNDLQRKHYAAALQAARKLLELRGANADTLVETGNIALKAEAWELAEQYFSRALAQQRNHAGAYCGIAAALSGGGDHRGAWLRAASLYRRGYRSEQLYQVFHASCPLIAFDRHTADQEALVMSLLEDSQVNPAALGTLAASLIRERYDLSNPDAVVDVADCARDPMLIRALLLTHLPDPHVEDLLTFLRYDILFSTHTCSWLADSLQTLAVALGTYQARVDYLRRPVPNEQPMLRDIAAGIEDALDRDAQPGDLTRSLLVLSQYRPLYTERFSFRLLKWKLEEWPTWAQTLMKASLYDPASEHALRHALERPGETLDADSARHSPWPRWSTLELVDEWQQVRSHTEGLEGLSKPEILVLGCGTGRRAIALAQLFPTANILAVDDRPGDLAYAARQADELECTNIEFSCGDWRRALPVGSRRFDRIECPDQLPPPSRLWCEELKRLFADHGHLHLVGSLQLSALETQTMPDAIPGSPAYREWRDQIITGGKQRIPPAQRQALFNREGARRLAVATASARQTLTAQLRFHGIEPVQREVVDPEAADTRHTGNQLAALP